MHLFPELIFLIHLPDITKKKKYFLYCACQSFIFQIAFKNCVLHVRLSRSQTTECDFPLMPRAWSATSFFTPKRSRDLTGINKILCR